MPGDELHQEAETPADAAPEAASARSGPRHAAPKKPLLTRLHVPAGKAVAIAAMPSAVLMGMGLTPQLASAKPIPKSPFRPGPCVSQPDKEPEHEKSEKEKAREKAEKEKIEAAKKKVEEARKRHEEEKKAGKDGSSGEDGSGKDTGDGSGSDSGSSAGSGDGSKDSGSSGSSDSDGKKKNPLDPLGVGDALGKVLGGDKDKKDESGDSGSDGKAGDKSGDSDAKSGSGGSGSGDSAGDAVGKVGDGVKDTTDKLGKGARDAADGLKGDEQDGKDGKSGKDGASDDQAGKSGLDGKKPFPCPKEKKSEGKDEQTPVPLPDESFQFEGSSLALHKLDYKGVVNITMSDGRKKQALKFTADSIDIGDLHQIVQGPNGAKFHIKAAKGSTSTFRGGQVTLYTEKLKGNLFGVVPIVFDPEHPPPINVPEAYFTHVEVTQAGQFGGNLTVPGLHYYQD